MKLTRIAATSFFATATLLLIAACDSKPAAFTKENVDKIHEGMTSTEVKTILGEPNIYVYKSGGTILKVTFMDNKVVIMEGNVQ